MCTSGLRGFLSAFSFLLVVTSSAHGELRTLYSHTTLTFEPTIFPHCALKLGASEPSTRSDISSFSTALIEWTHESKGLLTRWGYSNVANPNKAINALFQVEGFRSDHSDDVGGLTYYGISKVFWPEWYERWGGPPDIDQAREFYKEVFWSPLGLDDVHDQRVADEILEQAVNLGHQRATRFAQMSVNLATMEPRLRVDGRLGPRTRRELNRLNRHDTLRWLKVSNGIQLCYYAYRAGKLDDITSLFRTEPDESQGVFLRGWLKRIEYANPREWDCA